MKTLLPKTLNRRKTRIVILRAELFREHGEPNWRLAIRHAGKRTQLFDTYTPHEASAREYARATIRQLTAPAAANLI